MKKRLLSLVMALVLIFSLFPFTAAAADDPADPAAGSCGENVTWTLSEDGVLTIRGEGPMADYTADHLPPYCVYNSDITGICICPGVTAIGDYAFRNRVEVTSVTIPDSVTSIGDYAFSGCSKLSDPALPESLTSIGDYAFNSCNALKSMTLPASVASVGAAAFGSCVSLTNLTFSENLTSISPFLCYNCRALTGVELPAGVTSVGDSAFRGCSLLKSVVLPDGLETIGTNAFGSCALVSVDIPETVTSIGTGAFSSNALTRVTIPAGVTALSNSVFSYCASLASVTIPASVTTIEQNAFSGCTALTDVYYLGTQTKWDAIEIGANNDPLLNAALHIIPAIIASGTCGENVTWTLTEDGVLTIRGEGAMADYDYVSSGRAPWYRYGDKTHSVSIYGVEIHSVAIESGVTTIGEYAFRDCSSLTSVEIPDSITDIRMNAFSGCSGLTSAEIPDSVKSIGNSAFYNCTDLTSVEIPASVTLIGISAFEDCVGLASVELPDSITDIRQKTFSGCSSLTSVTIPDSVTSIGYAAFEGCSSLTDISIPDSVKTIQSHVFSGCSSLTSVMIPVGVDRIYERAFSGCSSLTSVTIPYNVYFDSGSANSYLFENCTSLTEVQGLEQKSVPDGCFSGCTALKEITVGGSIGESAFQNCTALETVTMTKGTEIGAYGLGGCTALQTVKLPKTLQSVAANAFRGDDALADVFYEGTQEQWNAVTIKASGNDPLLNARLHIDHEHAWGDWVIVTRSTETSEGLQQHTCTICGDTEQRVTPKLDYITAQPQDASGYEEDEVTVQVGTTDAALTFRWEISLDNGQTWADAACADAALTVTLSEENDGALCRCIVSDDYGYSLTTRASKLTLRHPIVLVDLPQDAAGRVGEEVTFSVSATGDSLRYQWQCSKDGGKTWEKLPGAETMAFTIADENCDGWRFRCTIRDAYGFALRTRAAKLTVITPLVITAQPQDYTGASGEVASFTVAAEGESLTYQWQYQNPGSTAWKNSSSTKDTATCTIITARDGRLYRCIVTDAYGVSVTTESARIIVKTSVTITAQPQDFTGASGAVATFKVSAEGEGLTYQWQYQNPGSSSWKNSSSTSDTATCTITAARDGRLYRCIVTASDGSKVVSEAAKIVVRTGPVITAQPQDYNGKAGTNAVFTVAAQGEGLTYQWQYKNPGGSWKNSASTTDSVTCWVTAARSGRIYRCIITDAYGAKTISETAEIIVTA